jgi:hypothetical protein
MQRVMSLLTALALGAGIACADRTKPDNTKTHFATPLPAPPAIDGVIDTAEWAGANGATGNWRISYNATSPNMVRGGTLLFGPDLVDANDLGVQIYAGYDTTDLYIAVRVTDNYLLEDSTDPESANAKVEEDDSVELYLDPLNANADTYTPGTPGGRYAIAINNAYAGSQSATYGPEQAWYARAARNSSDTGYDVEFRISLKSLSDPKFGDVLGFTVVVNDDKDGGAVEKTMDRQVSWVGEPNKPAGYGNLIFGHKTYSAPQVTKAPVVDGKISTDEYASATLIPINLATGEPQTGAGTDAWPAGTFEASAWAVHDATAVYVAVDVIDTNVVTDTAEAGSEDGTTWEDDSVEVFFDADLDLNRGGPSVDYEGQYVLTANGAHRDTEARNPTFGEDGDWYAATSLTSQGYQIEFKINKTALLDPQLGATMGFNIALNNDNGAGRAAQLSWNGDPHQEYTYGQLTLVAAAVTPPTLAIARVANGDVTISWQSTAAFTLETKAQLADTTWTTVPGVTGNSVTVKPTATAAFYRLRQ